MAKYTGIALAQVTVQTLRSDVELQANHFPRHEPFLRKSEAMHTKRIWGSNLWKASKHLVIFRSDQAVIFF